MPELTPDDAKRLAAAKALEYVAPGMRLGLGTGTTAAHFIELLGARIAEGLDVTAVPTSEATRALASRCGIPLAAIDSLPELDLTVDGTDEFDPQLRLIKGGGGALLREKIVATASSRMIVIADWTKSVPVLGRYPLPVAVNVFGLEVTRRRMLTAARACGCEGEISLRRTQSGEPFRSDDGHYIVDCHFGAIPCPDRLACRFAAVPGVIEHGLFIGIAQAVISAGPAGIEIFGRID